MVNKSKQKGTRWENEFVYILNSKIRGADVRRIAGSGALGSILNEPLLQSDVVAKFPGLPKKFRVECKVGYGGDKQLTVKKEWIDKVKQEADNSYSYPMVACKFLGAKKKEGAQFFVILDLDTFTDIINYVGSVPDNDNWGGDET